jgi:class III poly(R)-hydroxyalkanoic acid synthase PhaE subunit
MDKNTNPFLNPEWINMQQQYVEALSSLKPEQLAPEFHGTNQQAWKDALDFWWKSAEPFLPVQNKSVFETIIRQASGYYAIADQFAVLLKEISTTDKATNDWQSVLAKHFGIMKAGFVPENSASFMWLQPIESWKQVMGSMSVNPNELLEQLNTANADNIFTRLAATPGIGPTGQYQDKIREANRLWETYQGYYREYNAAFTELSKLSLDRLETKIIARSQTGKTITSIREIYNLWIDASEEVFAEFAFNQDYARLYGNLVNSLMDFKQHYDDMVDDLLPLLNLPTKQSMQTVYKRQQQMRQHLQSATANQQEMADVLQQLRTDMHKLRNQLHTNKAAASNKPGGSGKRKKKKSA